MIRYVFQRRVEGKRQLERINSLTAERGDIVRQRLKFPDIVSIRNSTIGRAITTDRKRRAQTGVSDDISTSPPQKRKTSVLQSTQGAQGDQL